MLLHIPFKMDACPLPRKSATAGPTATSAKDYMLQLAALLSAPGFTETGRGVGCEQPECGREFTGREVVVREVRISAAQNEMTVGSYRRRS